MEIERFDDGKKGYFRAVEGDIEAGKMTYVWAGEKKMIIDHTEGNPDFKGVGIKMLNTAVAYARANDITIIPLCPFAKKMFDRTEDIRDVLAS
jgi:uncharacterized protein